MKIIETIGVLFKLNPANAVFQFLRHVFLIVLESFKTSIRVARQIPAE